MPCYLVVSDVHASVPAIEAVRAAAGDHDGLISLGDMVGYGPHPNEAVAFVREHAAFAILGNHDMACYDKDLLDWFNGAAREAVIFSRDRLTQENLDYVKTLPLQAGTGPFVFIHSSLLELWGYVYGEYEALQNLLRLKAFKRRILFVGHTHRSEVYRIQGERITRKALTEGDTVDLSGDDLLLINPGSVGQPRDADPRLGFGLLDTDAMTYTQRRVPYDIAAVQEAMRAERLPDYLIDRLTQGR